MPTGRAYSEIYAGLSGKHVGTRFSLSPDYLGKAHWTVHWEINGLANLTASLYLDGQLGVLLPLGSYGSSGSIHGIWDARLGLAQRVGRVSLHGAVTARGRNTVVYGNWGRSRVAVILGISTSL